MNVRFLCIGVILGFAFCCIYKDPYALLGSDYRKRVLKQVEVEGAYFWLDDVGDVFSGKKEWETTKISRLPKDEFRKTEGGFFDFAIVIRVRNSGLEGISGVLEIKQLKDQRLERHLSIPRIKRDKDIWSLYVITYRETLLTKEYIENGPYVVWEKISVDK